MSDDCVKQNESEEVKDIDFWAKVSIFVAIHGDLRVIGAQSSTWLSSVIGGEPCIYNEKPPFLYLEGRLSFLPKTVNFWF